MQEYTAGLIVKMDPAEFKALKRLWCGRPVQLVTSTFQNQIMHHVQDRQL
jgi:hypothetical protein